MDSRDLQDWIEELRIRHGFRLDAIFPADRPRIAELSGFGLRLRLETDGPAGPESAMPGNSEWQTGRAGMQYRDLIPSRLGGEVIASHIRIPVGGEVPDYVHYHEVAFQIIYCKAGWVKVVYEDQGEPFVMSAGDCVLQPPTIRHRVLECSDGMEVVEIGSPAEHRTLVDHEMELPNGVLDRGKTYEGQSFVRHQVEQAIWKPWGPAGLKARDLGMSAATGGSVDVQVVRATAALHPEAPIPLPHVGGTRILFLLQGEMSLSDGRDPRGLAANDCLAWQGRQQPAIQSIGADAVFLLMERSA